MIESTTTKEAFSPDIDRVDEYDKEVIDRLGRSVTDFLDENNIDPQTVLFSGYAPGVEKPAGGEHGDMYYFGTVESMQAPEDLAPDGDEEEHGDRWAVNPLKYAIEGGALGIYSREALQQLRSDEEPDLEYGTYSFNGTPDEIATAEVGRVFVRKN